MADNEFAKALDILEKHEFFGGQRAGRELWSEKPVDVQNKDIEDFVKDFAYLKDFIIRIANIDLVNDATVVSDIVEVDDISDKIIRKKAEVSDYWHNDVKKYRASKGYPDIEHEVDNFLRGYNEAIEDVLAILDGTLQKERADNG